MGFDEDMVKRVIKTVDRNEYKRRQAAPGVKITPRNFGRDRRMPIVNHYRVLASEKEGWGWASSPLSLDGRGLG